jgi:hypothetical protein
MESTPFMTNLSKAMMAPRKDKDGKDKDGLAESSSTMYIKSLFNLNGKKPFKSLSFLKKTADIDKALERYAENTKKTLLGIIVGSLVISGVKGYGKTLAHYQKQLGIKAKELRAIENTNDKTEKQSKNWESLEDINKNKAERWTTLKEKIGKKAKITPAVYEDLLSSLVVALYTDTSPRRNQDYMRMVVVKKWKPELNKDVNYLDLAGQRFVFNVYKTSRKYGEHIVNIPNELMSVINVYLKYHPLKSSKWATPQAFLVYHDGRALTVVNAITRILNKWFGKNIGSSMLRHIWMTNKINIEALKQTAADMGHSLSQNLAYVKND